MLIVKMLLIKILRLNYINCIWNLTLGLLSVCVCFIFEIFMDFLITFLIMIYAGAINKLAVLIKMPEKSFYLPHIFIACCCLFAIMITCPYNVYPLTPYFYI